MPVDAAWAHVLALMVGGRDVDVPIRGTIRSHHSRQEPGNAMGWFGFVDGRTSFPVFTGGSSRNDEADGTDEADDASVRVWREGPGMRVEEVDGSPSVIADGRRCWTFGGHDIPLVTENAELRFAGRGTHLLAHRSAGAFVGDGFTRPIGPVEPTTFLGRSAWAVELASTSVETTPMQLVVDDETGLVLQQRRDATGAVDEWTELVVGEPADPRLFSWAGEAHTAEERHDDGMAEHELDRDTRLRWFADNVGASRWELPLVLPLEVEWVHTYDDSGAFEASLGPPFHGSLSRRPRSDAAWDLEWQEVQHRWSTPRWDWAVTLHDLSMTPATFAELERRLGSD